MRGVRTSSGIRSSFGSRFFPKLLPQTSLIRTGSCYDEPGLNFHPLLGIIARLRFYIILSLLPERHFPRLLEIGYGSGIFMPELAQHCDELYGVDMHHHGVEVLRHLRRNQVHAELTCGSGTALPFQDRTFDCIVAMSCLEYMDPLESAASETRRLLRPGGCFVFVTPGNSPVIDSIHDLLTNRPVKQGYADRRDRLFPTLRRHFVVEREAAIPQIGNGRIALYRGMRLRPL